MKRTTQLVFFALLIFFVCSTLAFTQSKGTIAPDQIPGIAVYIPFPVSISLDGKLNDWKDIPVQRVETGYPKGPDPSQNQFVDFSVAADTKNLYVYMQSTDSNIIAGQHGEDYWNEDSMEFYVNFSKNLTPRTYSREIFQITINATNIGKKDGEKLVITGTNSAGVSVHGCVFKTSDGWAFEVAIPFPKSFSSEHGKTIGFQVHANGASKKDRDSKLIWSIADTGDSSYQDPSVFGQAIFFKTGSKDIPEPLNLANDLASIFEKHGGVGKAGKKIVWADEFDYTGKPNPKKWAYDAPDAGKWNQELQEYTSSQKNSYVENGKLTISAIKDSAGKWTSARLFTNGKADWKYGYFEIKAKLPAGKGTWPAIWMMPTKSIYGYWPDSGEIDIMEFVGFDPSKIHASVHTKSFNHRIQTQKTRNACIDNVTEEYHTYAIEWTDKGIFWYVDNKPFYMFENSGKGFAEWPFDMPFFIILNVAMGGSWGGMNGMDSNLNRAEMVVDYVRVYQ